MPQKGLLSKSAKLLRESIKTGASHLISLIFRSKSYPVFGIARGLVSCEGRKKILYPSTPVHYLPPKTIDESIFPSFQEMLRFDRSEEGLYTLPNAIATDVGGNLNAEGRLVTSFLQKIDNKPYHRHELLRPRSARFFPKIARIECPLVTLSTGWQGAFYHWMHEVLPRLHLVRKAGYSLEKIFVSTALPFQKESLKLLGISEEKIIDASTYSGVLSPLVISSSIPHPSEWSCEFLREAFIPHFSVLQPSRRLYLSRKDATRRRIVNEEKVFALLEKKGFEKIELAHLPLLVQMEHFASAKAIVAPHGAGLSHLTFCAPQTKVLEIFSPRFINTCYFQISREVDLDYAYLFASETDEKLDPDLYVDLKKLEQSLELLDL